MSPNIVYGRNKSANPFVIVRTDTFAGWAVKNIYIFVYTKAGIRGYVFVNYFQLTNKIMCKFYIYNAIIESELYLYCSSTTAGLPLRVSNAFVFECAISGFSEFRETHTFHCFSTNKQIYTAIEFAAIENYIFCVE